jgi:hypothetical protein
MNPLEDDELDLQSLPTSVSHNATSEYKSSFNRIVELIRNLRHLPVSPDELDVTEKLAGPFTSGGLFVLLQEPLWEHPWEKGVEAVISECPALDILREGIWATSDGTLSLIDNVSVLDRWPLLNCHEAHMESNRYEMDTLDTLVIQAIQIKRPDVILCMGKVTNQYT